MLAASDDVETQRKGITSIVWPGRKPVAGDNASSVKWDRVLFMKRIYENLPIRTCSIHFCLPDTPVFQIMRSLIVLTMPSYRHRMKFHVGTLCFYYKMFFFKQNTIQIKFVLVLRCLP